MIVPDLSGPCANGAFRAPSFGRAFAASLARSVASSLAAFAAAFAPSGPVRVRTLVERPVVEGPVGVVEVEEEGGGRGEEGRTGLEG